MSTKNDLVLILDTADNRAIELTSSKLESWFAHVENPQAKKEEYNQFSTQLLSRFGIKSPASLISYLNSPEGKVISGIISKELAEEEADEEDERFEQYELQMKRRRYQMHLLLGLLHKKEKIAKRQHEHELQERLELEHQYHQEQDNHQPAPEPVIRITVQSLQNAELALDRLIKLKRNEIEVVMLELLQLSKINENQLDIHQKLSLKNELLKKELHLLTKQLNAVQADRIALQKSIHPSPKMEPTPNAPRPAPELKIPQISHPKQLEQTLQKTIMNQCIQHQKFIVRENLEYIEQLNIRLQNMTTPRMTPRSDRIN